MPECYGAGKSPAVLPLPPEILRQPAGDPFENLVKMLDIAVAHLAGDVGDAPVGGAKKPAGLLDAQLLDVADGRGAGQGFEGPGEGGDAHAAQGGQLRKPDLLGVAGADVVQRVQKLPGIVLPGVQTQAEDQDEKLYQIPPYDFPVSQPPALIFLQHALKNILNVGVLAAVGPDVDIALKIVVVKISQKKMVVDIEKIPAAGQHPVEVGGGEDAVVDGERAVPCREFVGNIIVDQGDVPLLRVKAAAADGVSPAAVGHVGDLHKVVGVVVGFRIHDASVDIGGPRAQGLVDLTVGHNDKIPP